MRNEVALFLTAREKLLAAFGCPGDYFIKPLLDCRWRITSDEGLFILAYSTADGKTTADTRSVIVKMNNKPMIFKADAYTLVVAIDCIKIACLLENKWELGV